MYDKFLSLLWPGDIPAGGHLLLWSRKPDPLAWDDGKRSEKRSWWCKNIGEARGVLKRHVPLKDRDWYIGSCLSGRAMGAFQRCKAADVTWMPGLWLDMDINDGFHKKGDRLPKSVDEARALLDAMPVPPSVVVFSGGGLQGWWLFDQPQGLVGESSHARGAALELDWNKHLLCLCAKRGWTTDSVHDLARVMRIPGTWNVKGGGGDGARATGLVGGVPDPVARYPFAALERMVAGVSSFSLGLDSSAGSATSATLSPPCESTPASSPATSAISPATSASSAGSQPSTSPAILEATLDVLFSLPQFVATWQRRRDFLDQSLSTYDAALALFCVNNEVEDHITADILRAFRMRHAKDQDERSKADRADYLERTIRTAHDVKRRDEEERIAKAEERAAAEVRGTMEPKLEAKQAKAASKAAERAQKELEKEREAASRGSKNRVGRIERLVLELGDGGIAGDTEKARTGLVAAISERLGMNVEGLTVYKAEPSTYVLHVEGLEVNLGGVQGLLTYSQFRLRVAEGAGVVLPVKMEGWDSIAKGLNAVRKVLDVGEDGTSKGLIQVCVEEYLRGLRTKIGADVAKALGRMEPFTKRGQVHISLTALMESSRELQRMSTATVASLLRQWGATPVVVGYAKATGDAIVRTTTRAYLLPNQERWTDMVATVGGEEVEGEKVSGAILA